MGQVKIVSITGSRRGRSLLAGSVSVNIQIAAASEEQAAGISEKLNGGAINGLLEQVGLPKAQVFR